MEEALFKYREGRSNNTTWFDWTRKHINAQLMRNSLLALNSAGVLTCCPENAHMLSKRNECWGFYLVVQGEGSFRRLHRETVSFSPGDMIVIAPQFVNMTFMISSPFLQLKFLELQNSAGVQHLCIQNVPEISLFHPSNFEKLISLHEIIMEMMKNQLLAHVSEYSILQNAFAFLYEIEHQCFTMEYTDAIRAIYNEINNFPDRSYSISELAEKSGLSVRTLQRRFKKQIGCSIQNLITICRIGLARRLLQNTFLSIAEIASCCYYKEVSFFSRAFKQETGMSPNEFRKKSIPQPFTHTSNLTSGLKSAKKVGIEELSPRKKQLLWLINEQRNISIHELARKMRINSSAVQKHIESLKKDKILQRSGPRRGGLWIISHP